MVTWGVTPGQSIGVSQQLPIISDYAGEKKESYEAALSFMGFQSGQSLKNQKVDVVFIGSCTNSRITDLREAAGLLKGKKVAPNTHVLVVPGSQNVKKQAEEEGLHDIFLTAGAEWRDAGCSMCLAMNTDKLIGNQLCASTSNRNFIGRQGSPTGRTLLMSPAMAAAAAMTGCVTDVRELL
jgi:3-isopropylmalate/(R)-2-methylmalate dehydratase large subunit